MVASAGISSAFGAMGGSGVVSEFGFAASNGVVGGLAEHFQGGKFMNGFASSAINSYGTGGYASAKANNKFENSSRERWTKYWRGNLNNVDSYFGGGYFETGLASGNFVWDTFHPEWSWAFSAASEVGIWTVGITGTASAGMVGGSFEVGLTLDFRDGFQIGGYATLEHAVGGDLSYGGVVNYHKPVESNYDFTTSSIDGWGESENLSVGAPNFPLSVDFTRGGNSAHPGFNPANYSSIHSRYTTHGFGASFGTPFGFTLNKGYTLTTPTFGW